MATKKAAMKKDVVKIAAPRKVAKKETKAKAPAKEKKRVDVPPLVDPWSILRYPHLTEKSIGVVEGRNTLVFIVDPRTTKRQVKWAVERAFNVDVVRVNTLNDRKNRKKAFVKLSQQNNALDIATRLGMI